MDVPRDRTLVWLRLVGVSVLGILIAVACDDQVRCRDDLERDGTLAYFIPDPPLNELDGRPIHLIDAAGCGHETWDREMVFDLLSVGWSPDGSVAVVSASPKPPGAQFDLYVLTGDGETNNIIGDELLALTAQGERYAKLQGGSAETLASWALQEAREHKSADRGPQWSPSGDWIAFLSGRESTDVDALVELYLVRPDGSDLRKLTSLGHRWLPKVVSFRWAPDGQRIAFLRSREQPFEPDANEGLYIVDLRDGSVVKVTEEVTGRFVWSPDSESLAFTGEIDEHGEIFVWRADGSISNLTNTPDLDAVSPSWSPEGLIAFASTRAEHERDARRCAETIYVADPLTGETWGLLDPSISATSPRWSPDGTLVAFVRIEWEDGFPFSGCFSTGIWVADSDGSNAELVWPLPKLLRYDIRWVSEN